MTVVIYPTISPHKLPEVNYMEHSSLPGTVSIECCDIYERFHPNIQYSKRNNYLVIASFKAFGVQFLQPILPRTILLLATFAQPLLVNQALLFVSGVKPESFGWALFGGFVCIYALICFSTAMYWEKVSFLLSQYVLN